MYRKQHSHYRPQFTEKSSRLSIVSCIFGKSGQKRFLMMNCADRRFRVLNQNDSTVKVVRYMLFWQAIDGARPSALSSLTKRSVTISIIYAIEAHRSTLMTFACCINPW